MMEACSALPVITMDQLQTALTVWLPCIVTAASALVALTPTPDPNTRLGKLYRIVEIAALAIGKAKDRGVIKPAPAPAEAAVDFLRSLNGERR